MYPWNRLTAKSSHKSIDREGQCIYNYVYIVKEYPLYEDSREPLGRLVIGGGWIEYTKPVKRLFLNLQMLVPTGI